MTEMANEAYAEIMDKLTKDIKKLTHISLCEAFLLYRDDKISIEKFYQHTLYIRHLEVSLEKIDIRLITG